MKFSVRAECRACSTIRKCNRSMVPTKVAFQASHCLIIGLCLREGGDFNDEQCDNHA